MSASVGCVPCTETIAGSGGDDGEDVGAYVPAAKGEEIPGGRQCVRLDFRERLTNQFASTVDISE